MKKVKFFCIAFILVCSLGGMSGLSSQISLEIGTTGLEIIWEKTLGGSLNDQGFSVIQTTDGGFVVAGVTNSFGTERNDYWIIKLGADGQHLWNQTFPRNGDEDDNLVSVIEATNGDIVVGGTLVVGAPDNREFLLFKLNGNGQHVWNHTYGAEA